MTFSPLAWATISTATVSPSVARSSAPSPARRMSPSWTVSPAFPAIFSTTILSPAATRYCLPPVRTTANMALSNNQNDVRAKTAAAEPRAGEGAATGAGRTCQRYNPSRGEGRILVPVLGLEPVAALVVAGEQSRYGRVLDRLVAVVGEEVLLADIGDIAAVAIVREEMVEGL